MQQMFLTTSKLLDQRFNAAWKESVTVAGIAQVIGYSHPDLRAEQATLAGLLHNIGALPILTYAEQNDGASRRVSPGHRHRSGARTHRRANT